MKWTACKWDFDKDNFEGIEVPNLPRSLADALVAKWEAEPHRSSFSTEIRISKPGDRIRYTRKPPPEGI